MGTWVESISAQYSGGTLALFADARRMPERIVIGGTEYRPVPKRSGEPEREWLMDGTWREPRHGSQR